MRGCAVICGRCGRDTEAGRTYSFRYGNKGPSTHYHDMERMQHVTTTPYRIVGVESVWVCDRCVRITQTVWLLPLVILLLFGAFTFAVEGSPDAESVPCLGISAVLMLAGIVYIVMAKQEFGERVAIRARRRALRSQGYNAFLTSSAYKRINKS
jgi:hypothetical protein